MSSDDVELFAFDKYGVSASKRTIVRVFPTISTPPLIPNMSTMRILDFDIFQYFVKVLQTNQG